MKWLQVKVIYFPEEPSLAAELIFAQMYNLGLTGLIETQPGRDESQDWVQDAPIIEKDYAITGFFSCIDTAKKIVEQLQAGLRAIQKIGHFTFILEETLVDEEDWAESWKSFFLPQRIGKHFVVKPTWHKYDLASSEVLIEIDPGMAFGTGSHPTTSLCLEVLEEIEVEGKNVLDIGTGSGILLIGAAKLRAAHLTGTDIDPVAIAVAARNLKLNHIPAEQYDLKEGDLVNVVTNIYDVVIVNILTDVILRLLPDIHAIVKENSLLLISGIIEENQKIIYDEMKNVGFEEIKIRSQDGWIVLWGHYRMRAKSILSA